MTRFHDPDPQITYREYTSGTQTVVMLEDTENEAAWIRSTNPSPVRQ